jgi:hypothetical protein
MEEQLKVRFTGDAGDLQDASKKSVSALDDVSAASTKVSQTLSQSSAQIARNAATMGGSIAKGANSATLAMTNLGRIVQDAPFGFMGISNNLNPMLESFQRLKAETGSTGSALKSLAGSLIGAGGIGIAVSVVSSLLVLFGDKLFKSGTAAEDQADKLNKAKEALNKYVDGLNDVNKANVKGAQAAQDQLTQLKVLYAATQNVNIPLAQRKKLVDELQDQYPKYFANISDEIILAGGAKNAYEKLTTAIIATAKARAAEDQLTDLAKQGLAVDQKRSENTVNQIKLQQQLNALKAKGLTETSATGEERLTSAGAKANKLQSQLNGLISEGNDLRKERNDLDSRSEQLAKFVQKTVEANPDALLKPGGNIPKPKATKEEKTKFLFDLLPFDPNGNLKAEDKSTLLGAIDKFQKEFGTILQGAIFTGTEDQRIAQARKLDLQIKAGNIKFDTASFKDAFSKLNKDSDIIPKDELDGLSASVVDEFIRGFQNESQRLKDLNLFGDFTNTTDLEKQIDLFKTKVKQLGAEIPQTIQGLDIFGNPIELTFDQLFDTSKISNKDAIDALKKSFDGIRTTVISQQEQLNKAINDTVQSIQVEGFSTIGQLIADSLTGSNIGDAFKAFETMLGGAVEALGKQIIALNVAALAAKKALKLTFTNPAVGIAAGIALVAVGAALKKIAGGGIKGFAQGGLVFGPTMGMVGEGMGTSRSNPEVIAPLDKLRKFINPNGAGSQHITVEGRVRGKDLVFVQVQTLKSQGRAT